MFLIFIFNKLQNDMSKSFINKILSEEQLQKIADKISEMEKQTSGEIRVSVKEGKPLFKTNTPIFDLAKDEFFKLKMNETRDKTGILLFMLLKEHQFQILADQGINDKVAQTVWDGIRDDMAKYFKEGNFFEGLIFGIDEVGGILAKFFPVKPDDTNELSNKVEY